MITRTRLRLNPCPRRRRRYAYFVIETTPHALRYLVIDGDGRERGRFTVWGN